ncbi:LacI family DNA-binding transcriptional regulator [Micromonospora endolithica]|uniref:LacI family transcriptional regulator n=1 Tax=Micromonospora endolithica TaxID=230091 RepID=A0A3A9YYL9_9ACTN|nr:LacI family DNA-binding transcriptional regulator [Micromonospora endolithica]RKN41138.1 LacI family transcriptional regulator [Micromonospora endolithica]TWJ24282.1 LacI family transcriptional regulator [Micromonospora endolithica]
MRTHPTVQQIAAAADVSPATVSRVLTGAVRVTTGARQRVYAAMTQLGYVGREVRKPDPRHPPVVALVVCEPTARVFADPFFARLAAGVEAELAVHGSPMPILTVTRENLPAIERYLLTGGADGVLLVGGYGQKQVARAVAAPGVPVRAVGRPADLVDVPYVDVDNRGGARMAVRHLLRSGRRRIATIAGPRDMPAAADRLAGYHEALAEAGVEPSAIAYGDFTQASGTHAMQWLIGKVPTLDAVFVASDAMAVGALHALRRAGRTVPDGVAVVGFDDAPVATLIQPALTTVRQPVEQLGRIACRLLLADVTEEKPTSGTVILPTELVRRRSA